MHCFLEALKVQGWDGHSHDQHKRSDQRLHLLSAITFRGRLWPSDRRLGDGRLATGQVCMVNILTEPFDDIKLYHRAPLHVLRKESIDPMAQVRSHGTGFDPSGPVK